MDRTGDQKVDIDHIAINKISQKLASNDPQLRNYTLKKLRRWLERSATSNDGLICEINLLRLWKGLHYCMWMADKPLFQEELADRLSALVGAFKRQEQALLFVSSFLKIEAQEWHLLDFFRLDKFMMLLRKVIIQSLKILQTHNWDSSLIEKFVAIVDIALKMDSAPGFDTHLLNVIKDELKQLLQGEFVQEDERIQQFNQLFVKRNRKLIDVKPSKKKKLISAAECKAIVKESLTREDIEEAARRMVLFEYENVVNQKRGNKIRERKRKRETEEDSDAQLDGNDATQEKSVAVEVDDMDDDDDLDDDDLSEEESSLDSLSDIEPTPKKPKTRPTTKYNDKKGRASREKMFSKKKLPKPVKDRSFEKKNQPKSVKSRSFEKKNKSKPVKGRSFEKKKTNKRNGK